MLLWPALEEPFGAARPCWVPTCASLSSCPQELGNSLDKCKNNENLQQILTNATIMVVSVTASTTQGCVDCGRGAAAGRTAAPQRSQEGWGPPAGSSCRRKSWSGWRRRVTWHWN